MRPEQSIPIDPSWRSNDEYVDALLTFISTSELFRNLCGGVHVLDFLTRKPDLYMHVLSSEWREWFEIVKIDDILDLLLREDLAKFDTNPSGNCETKWRDFPPPPRSLITYISTIRRLSLNRKFRSRNAKAKQDLEVLPKHIAVGMKPKKIHEVTQFAALVDELSQHVMRVQDQTCTPSAQTSLAHLNQSTKAAETCHAEHRIIDFGSGQNYLGRTLACPPYNKQVIAIEQRHHNVEGARSMDISAKLIKKEKFFVNKKEWKAQWEASRATPEPRRSEMQKDQTFQNQISEEAMIDIASRIPHMMLADKNGGADAAVVTPTWTKPTTTNKGVTSFSAAVSNELNSDDNDSSQQEAPTSGSVSYVEKELSSGDLNDILLPDSPSSIVVSIHSCGNLTHHGLRSIALNPSVRAVALVGCCYNLLTERLGPPTYKLPNLRSNHPRLEAISSAFDPHGFPMSAKLEKFTFPVVPSPSNPDTCRKVYSLNGELQDIDTTGRGVRLNITARMMAVQAPQNWGPKDSEDFFTRHFYRALLQRILLDLGVVKMAAASSADEVEIAGGTLSGKDEAGTPLMIGSLRKSCFTSFPAYVRGAMDKLIADPVDGQDIDQKTACLFENEGSMIKQYENRYHYAKKHLSVIWSLMAFSASVVESTILIDRWLWLKEQDEVEDAWVEAVFDYKRSPRNMVIVGLKKQKLNGRF